MTHENSNLDMVAFPVCTTPLFVPISEKVQHGTKRIASSRERSPSDSWN